MEEDSLLLKSLRNVGVSIPSHISSIGELIPSTLVSICAQGLNLLDKTASFPSSFPDFTVDKFKICTEIASDINRLGYMGDMTYNKLYPSEEDLYKLVRFLVERLPQSSNGVGVADVNAKTIKIIKEGDSSDNLEYFMAKADIKELDFNHQHNKLKALNHSNVEPELLSDINIDDTPFTGSRTPEFGDDELSGAPSQNLLTAEEGDDNGYQKVTSDNLQSSKIRNETEILQSQEKALKRKVIAMTFELQQLEEEYNLLKAAADMALDDEHPIDFYLEQLNHQVDSRRHNITELESEWDAFRKPLVEKKISLEESLYAHMPDAQEKLQKLREVELEKQSILSEVKRREEDYSKLCLELEKQSGLPSRITYIERIKEITKNSRKQDADIERILKETRELQLESNSIQDSLHRTYAVLDEMVFREAKKEPVGRQAYRLLTSIHECFEQISEKILVTDRIRREMADHEKKLTAMAARGLDVEKLQDDLNAIRKENEKLEQLKEN